MTASSTNTIYHTATMPSTLVLGGVIGARAKAHLPACNTVDFEPCRTNATPVPNGTLALDLSGSLAPSTIYLAATADGP